MTTLENDLLRITVSADGAELHAIFDKKRQRECLWQADPAVWNRHAPHLFPVVGACLNNELEIDGIKYPMPKHGFVRDMPFTQLDSTPTHVKYTLRYTEATYKAYPYKFEFQVLYDLFENALRVSYKVINLDKYRMWFSLGAHPAFNVPFSAGRDYDAYYLEFDTEELLTTHLLAGSGYFSGETRPVPLEGSKLRLTKDLFSQDALVFKDLKSRSVTVKSDGDDGSILVSFPHFNSLGIWAKSGADFVCIEPWLGYSDTEGEKRPIREKGGIQFVDHGHVFETEMTIAVG